MSTATVAATSASPSASSSAPSSTVPLTSASALLLTSSPSATIGNTSSDNRSTTSAAETSVPSTTPSTTTTTNTTQIPSPTSFPPGTAVITITSATPISASISNTPLTSTSSPLAPSTSPQNSLGRVETPITTLLESTTIFITSTNNQGQVVTSIPPVVTEVITTTGSGGTATTITQAVINPTLAPPNNRTTGSLSFLSNTGAVVGVFVAVGLASASIMMWILFAIRHRQRMRRIEQDTTVEAAVAAAGLHRTPLDDDDDEDDSPISPNSRLRMAQRSTLLGFGGSGSLPTSTRLSATLDGTIKDSLSSHPGIPAEPRHPDGYVPARTTSPSHRAERCIDDLGSSRDRKSSYGHTPTYSAGSFEPLLVNYLQNTPDQDAPVLVPQPPRDRSPRRPGDGLVPNIHSFDGIPEGSRASSRRQNSFDDSLREEEDYTRYVLMVRNIADDQSQHSV